MNTYIYIYTGGHKAAATSGRLIPCVDVWGIIKGGTIHDYKCFIYICIMCVYIYIYVYTHIHEHIHYVCTYVCIHTHAYVYVCISCMCIYIYIYIYIVLYVMYIYIYIYITYTYICMYICTPSRISPGPSRASSGAWWRPSRCPIVELCSNNNNNGSNCG